MTVTDPTTREQWLAERRTGIGGSDAAAICGLDRWRSPLEVYLDKTGELPLDQGAGEAADWGNLLEPIVADEVARRTGLTLTPAPALLRHPEHDWMLGNIDRWADDPQAGERGIYEGKTVGLWLADGWDEGRVPDRAAIQGMHYLAVTGAPWVLFGCLVGGQRLVTARMERDERAIADLVAIEARFWEQVQERRPPDPDGSPATTDLLGRLYDVEPESIAVLDPGDVDHWLAQRAEAKEAIKAATERAAEAENHLKVLLGEKELGVIDGDVVITWKEVPATVVETYERAAYRRFHVTKRGADRV